MKKSVKKPVKKLIKRQGGGPNPFGTTVNLLRPDDNSIYATTSKAPVQALSAIPGGYVPKTREQRLKDFENLARTKAYWVESEVKGREGKMNSDATAAKILQEYPGTRRDAIKLAQSITGLEKGRVRRSSPSSFKQGLRNIGDNINKMFTYIPPGADGNSGMNQCGPKGPCGQFKRGGAIKMTPMIPSGGAMKSMTSKKRKK